MAIRDIVTIDCGAASDGRSAILRVECSKITTFDDELRSIVEDLRDTLRSDTLSVGLAAPQIGIDAAVAVVNLNKEKDEDLVLINPEVLETSGQWDEKYESCMSRPHKRGVVRRRKKVKIRYQDMEGQTHELAATSFKARVILHEIDHLNGVLFSDHLDSGHELEETDLFRQHGIE